MDRPTEEFILRAGSLAAEAAQMKEFFTKASNIEGVRVMNPEDIARFAEANNHLGM